jgi:hypothetical protein
VNTMHDNAFPLITSEQSSPCRGSAIVSILVVVLIFILVAAGFVLWRSSSLAAPVLAAPTAPNSGVRTPAADDHTAAITAVRQAENLPTYLQTGLSTNQGAAVGGKLVLLRDGKAVATMLIESCDADGSSCRILPDSWATGVDHTVKIGESVRLP